MIEIKNLYGIPLVEIIDCLLIAFDGYYVKMPESSEYWEQRFKGSRVDWNFSYGVFDQHKLVGFLINGIDDGIAFNTGTGVVPHYRGKRLVDNMYAYAIPILKNNNIHRCALEVITKNERAIKLYERLGFIKVNEMKCYFGTIDCDETIDVENKICPFLQLDGTLDNNYSWDNNSRALKIQKDQFLKYNVYEKSKEIGTFIINPHNGNLAQYEIIGVENYYSWSLLFQGIRKVCKKIKLNNVPITRSYLCDYLSKSGLSNSIDQYEMEKPL